MVKPRRERAEDSDLQRQHPRRGNLSLRYGSQLRRIAFVASCLFLVYTFLFYFTLSSVTKLRHFLSLNQASSSLLLPTMSTQYGSTRSGIPAPSKTQVKFVGPPKQPSQPWSVREWIDAYVFTHLTSLRDNDVLKICSGCPVRTEEEKERMYCLVSGEQ